MKVTRADLREMLDVSNNSDKIRFRERSDESGTLIAMGSAQGHGGNAIEQLDFNQVLTPAYPGDGRMRDVMLHGTMRVHASSIARNGLLPGGRRGPAFRAHIHCVAAIEAERTRPQRLILCQSLSERHAGDIYDRIVTDAQSEMLESTIASEPISN